MKKVLLFILALLLQTAVCSELYYTSSFALQYPPGIQNDSRLFIRFDLYDSDNILFKDSKIDIGIQNKLTPSYDYLGVRMNIEPIAILDITLSAGVFAAFEALGFPFLELQGYDSDFNDAALDLLEPLNRTGTYAYLCPTVKMAFGKMIAMHSITINYFNMGTRSKYFFERMSNAIMAQEDVNLENETYFLYKFNPGIMLGLQHYYLYIPDSKYISQRISLTSIFTPQSGFAKGAYVVTILGGFLRDKYYDLYFALLIGKEFQIGGDK